MFKMTKTPLSKKIDKIEVKTYKTITVFNSTRAELKLPKWKELRLRQIVKEIIQLNQKMEDLFKK